MIITPFGIVIDQYDWLSLLLAAAAGQQEEILHFLNVFSLNNKMEKYLPLVLNYVMINKNMLLRHVVNV